MILDWRQTYRLVQLCRAGHKTDPKCSERKVRRLIDNVRARTSRERSRSEW